MDELSEATAVEQLKNLRDRLLSESSYLVEQSRGGVLPSANLLGPYSRALTLYRVILRGGFTGPPPPAAVEPKTPGELLVAFNVLTAWAQAAAVEMQPAPSSERPMSDLIKLVVPEGEPLTLVRLPECAFIGESAPDPGDVQDTGFGCWYDFYRLPDGRFFVRTRTWDDESGAMSCGAAYLLATDRAVELMIENGVEPPPDALAAVGVVVLTAQPAPLKDAERDLVQALEKLGRPADGFTLANKIGTSEGGVRQTVRNLKSIIGHARGQGYYLLAWGPTRRAST